MLEEFKIVYDMHRWLKYVIWAGLLSVTFFLVWLEGGFPPQSWRVLAQSITQFPHLWATRGPSILLPIAGLIPLSLVWLVLWCLLLWACLKLARHHKLDERQLAWIESYKLALHAPITLLNEHTAQEDIVTMPRLRLPHKPSSIPHLQARSEQGQPSSHPFLVSSDHTERVERVWRRERTSNRPIADVPTTPDRPSRRPVAAATRTQTRLEVGVGWNSGITRRRQPNEDSLVVLQGTCTYDNRLVPFGLFVVADGMGGHDFGQEASHIAIQGMMQVVLRDIATSTSLSDEVLTEMLISGVEQANRTICQHVHERGKEMGTTLTAALVVDTNAYIVNVGDSRTYLHGQGSGLSQITHDHSLVASLVIAGKITPDEVYTHPERNKVYRSLGNRDGVDVDWFTRELRRGDSLLLCSDGLWEMVRDPEMERLMSSRKEPTQVCDDLVQAALRSGGVDNVSVIVVRVA